MSVVECSSLDLQECSANPACRVERASWAPWADKACKTKTDGTYKEFFSEGRCRKNDALLRQIVLALQEKGSISKNVNVQSETTIRLCQILKEHDEHASAWNNGIALGALLMAGGAANMLGPHISAKVDPGLTFRITDAIVSQQAAAAAFIRYDASALGQLNANETNACSSIAGLCSGNLGVPRAIMPQFERSDKERAADYIATKLGVTYRNTEISASDLVPTQNTIILSKLERYKARYRDNPSAKRPTVLLSSDLHIIDGHHNTLAYASVHPDGFVNALIVNALAKDVLPVAVTAPFATFEGMHTSAEKARRTASNIAKDLAKTVQDVEKRVTPTLEEVAKSTGGELEGLEFKIKSQTSVMRKLEKMLLAGTPSDKAAAQVKDMLRYTLIFEEDLYYKRIEQSIQMLGRGGLELLENRNYWKQGDMYQGYHAWFRDPKCVFHRN